MKNKSVIVAIDVGKKGAYTIYDIQLKDYLEKKDLSFDNSYVDIYKEFYSVIKGLKAAGYGNILLIIGEAFGQRKVVKKHSKFYGVIELVCESEKLQLNYESDSTCRAAILGKGNGRNKEMVHELFKGKTPDISDCMLFTNYQLMQLNEDHITADRKRI
jgi:Holliday junction resolvasome RuvABC endonuclease subunit